MADQVRSECLMCTFRASCCSARLSRSQVSAFAGTGNKRGEGVRGDRLHWRVQGSMSSPTGIGSRQRVVWGLWNLECPVGLSQREICAHFNEGNLVQFGWSAEFSRPKSSSVSGNHDYVIYSITSVMLASKKYSNNRKEGEKCFI